MELAQQWNHDDAKQDQYGSYDHRLVVQLEAQPPQRNTEQTLLQQTNYETAEQNITWAYHDASQKEVDRTTLAKTGEYADHNKHEHRDGSEMEANVDSRGTGTIFKRKLTDKRQQPNHACATMNQLEDCTNERLKS